MRFRDGHSCYFFKLKEALECAAKRQIKAQTPKGLMMTVLQLSHAVEAKARRTAPHGDISVSYGELLHRVIAFLAAELERRRQTERN